MTDWPQNINHGRTIAHFYFWPKLGHYLYLTQNHLANIDERTAVESVQFFLNAPIYLMCACYLFKLRLPYRTILVVIYAIALLDELQYFVLHIGGNTLAFGTRDFNFYSDFETLVMIAPLYTIAFLYLFASSSLWAEPDRESVRTT